MCRVAGARCACRCHGSGNQRPPATPRPHLSTGATRGTAKDRPIFERKPAVAMAQPDPPIKLVDAQTLITCDQCGRVFGTDHAVAVHRARSHKITGATKSGTRKPVAAKPKPAVEVETDGLWLVGVITTDGAPRAETIVLGNRADAEQVQGLLTRLGHTPSIFRVPA